MFRSGLNHANAANLRLLHWSNCLLIHSPSNSEVRHWFGTNFLLPPKMTASQKGPPCILRFIIFNVQETINEAPARAHSRAAGDKKHTEFMLEA